MTIPAKVGRWVSKARWRLYFLFLLLMIVPIAFFTYSAGQVLRHQAETQAVTESTQIAHVAYRDWYKGVAGQWNPYVSEVYQTAVAPYQLVVAIAVPVRDDAGKPIGILMAPHALDTMSRELVETKLEGGWTISLVDQNGHLSAHPNIDSYAAPVDLSGYEPVKQLRASRSSQGTFGHDGNSFFARYEPVPPYGWGVLVEQPSAALHQGVRAIERRVWRVLTTRPAPTNASALCDVPGHRIDKFFLGNGNSVPQHPAEIVSGGESGNRLTAVGGSRERPLILVVDDEVSAP